MNRRLLTVFALAALAAISSAQQVYMSGLSNPRGMFFDTDGTLYVAEAGSGGGTFGIPFTGGGGSGTFGLSGGISSRKGAGAQLKALTGLPSISDATGEGDATGVHDIARTADGRFAVLFGFGSSLPNRAGLGTAGSMMGTLSYFDPTSHAWSLGQDYVALEHGFNPDGGEDNSNPFALASDGQGGFVVADGGANALWRPGGATALPSQLVANPFGPGQIPQEAVATSVVARPGGGWLVGELGGFPFSPGQSRIHSIGADGAYLGSTKYGLTGIIDMAYASDGSLLVLQIAEQGLLVGGPGALKRIRQDGTIDTLIGGLITPTSFAFGGDGALYVTNNALSGNGQVLKYAYTPVPEPATMAVLAVGLAGVARRRRKA